MRSRYGEQCEGWLVGHPPVGQAQAHPLCNMLLVATLCSLGIFEDVREGFYLASCASGSMCFMSCVSHIRVYFTCSDQRAFQVADLVLLRRRVGEGADSDGCTEILCLVEKAATSGGRREQRSLEVLVSAAVKGSGATLSHACRRHIWSGLQQAQ